MSGYLSKTGERDSIEIDDILKNFKNTLDIITSSQKDSADKDIFFAESLSLLNTTISIIEDKTKNLTTVILDLLKNNNFDQAGKILSEYHHKVDLLFQEMEAVSKKTYEIVLNNSTQLTATEKLYKKRLDNFEKGRKKTSQEITKILANLKTQIETSFDNWINYSKQEIEKNVSKLQSFLENTEKKFAELLNLGIPLEALKILKSTQERAEKEIERQKKVSIQLSKELGLLLKDPILKWDKIINDTELKIQKLISDLKPKIELISIQKSLSNLDSFYDMVRQKLSGLSSLLDQKKLIEFEKEFKELKDIVQTEFNNHKQRKLEQKIMLSRDYQEIPSHLNALFVEWDKKLEERETEIQDLLSKIEKSFNQVRLPQLLNKIDVFIEKNIEELNQLLDQFKTQSMNLLQSHFTQPNDTIRELLKDQKKKILNEFKEKERHIQLVFSRYSEYNIDEKKEKWEKEYKEVQEGYNEIKSKVFNFLELKDEIGKALDRYYELAKPAYGYKVPIKLIGEYIGDFPADKLENLFFELISNNFVSGEIDPVTKVVVLAPRVTEEQRTAQKLKPIRCIVCNLTINPAKEELIYCPYCNSPAHRAHLIEWVKIKGACPNCKREIKMF